jgi:hypothetical protein
VGRRIGRPLIQSGRTVGYSRIVDSDVQGSGNLSRARSIDGGALRFLMAPFPSFCKTYASTSLTTWVSLSMAEGAAFLWDAREMLSLRLGVGFGGCASSLFIRN